MPISANPVLLERFNIDRSGSADPMSDDFDGSSLDTSKWTWQNQQGATTYQYASRLIITSRESVGSVQALLQPAPSGNWTFRMKMNPEINPSGTSGIALISAEGLGASDEIRWMGTWGIAFRGRVWSDFSATSSSAWGAESRITSSEMYSELSWDGTDLVGRYTVDRSNWNQLATVTTGYTPAYIGIGYLNQSNNLIYQEIDWVRRIA